VIRIAYKPPTNQAKSWECFRDFVAAVGMFLQVALFAYTTTTTRQNHGNVSAILLQLWDFSASCIMLIQPPQPGKKSWEYFRELLVHLDKPLLCAE